MTDNSILPNKRLDKHDVGNALRIGIARAAATVGGNGTLADKIGASMGTVNNALTGKSLPEFHTGWNLLAADDTALDEVAAKYGKRLVPLDAVCFGDSRKAGPAIVSALAKVIGAEADGRIDHAELLNMEPELIEAEREIEILRARINSIRGVVSLPVRGKVA